MRGRELVEVPLLFSQGASRSTNPSGTGPQMPSLRGNSGCLFYVSELCHSRAQLVKVGPTVSLNLHRANDSEWYTMILYWGFRVTVNPMYPIGIHQQRAVKGSHSESFFLHTAHPVWESVCNRWSDSAHPKDSPNWMSWGFWLWLDGTSNAWLSKS